MSERFFQAYYDESASYCYGCGTLNEHGLHIRSYWDGDESVCRFEPAEYHTSIRGFVYGGLVASLIDCHGCGMAAAVGYKLEGRAMGSEPPLRYVTASLKVDYLKPTPIDVLLELRGRVKEAGERKVVVEVSVRARGEERARGEVVAVKIPDGWGG